MEKQNDYFLNLLSNPTFGADDFSLVGLSVDNTSILDKSVYLNSNYIKNLDIFKTNGSFDQSKFDNFYDYAKKGFSDLVLIKENDDLGTTWRAYRNDISMPENLRDNSPQFKILKVANPLRQQEGFVNFSLKENPTQSIREIAQTLQVWDPETNSWKETPNETPFDNFFNPKVLATWDSDGTHKDPITGEMVKHSKGERILNANGTYYYENLGNRSVYGKEVLSGFDTLTTDGSVWNKLDFLDSDDLEKSTGGSLMRAAALILPAFIPGVNTWYIGARVGLGMAQILPAVGKTLESLTGIDTSNSFFNKIEAWDKALSFSQSDYAQGSQTDDGKVLQDSHVWSAETGLKLIADVFTLLAEQRWMFEKSTSLFSGLKKEVIYDKEAQNKWMQDYIAKNSKPQDMETILRGMAKGVNPETTAMTALNVNWIKAQRALQDKLKGALDLGSKVSMAYMTGITTASSFGEAKQLGASDLEAALFTLGYTFGEWKLLNSELGRWILPELKSEERHIKNVVGKAIPEIKKASEIAKKDTELGKLKWYLKLFNIGKKAYNNSLGEGIANETIGSTVSNMASEALEETSEELLLDFSKVIFNAATNLVGSDTKFDDAFKNVFDRYALSFLGGAVGGGIAGTLPAYRAARADRKITQESAVKEIVDFVQQGKEKELNKAVDKMTFGSRYTDEQGNQVDDYTKSQDYLIKLNFKRLVTDIKDILTVNGADLDLDSLLKELGTLDIRYGMLATLASLKSNSISWYLNRYNELSSQLVTKSLELKGLEDLKTDLEKRNESPDDVAREKQLKEEIKNIKEELDKFKDGTMSDEFIQDALFEMTSKISGVYVPTDPNRWIEELTGKRMDELNDAERREWLEKFEASKPIRRDLTRLARQVHIKNMEWLSKAIENYDEEYFKGKKGAIENLEKVFFGDRAALNPEAIVPQLEGYLSLRSDRINDFLHRMEEAILLGMDETLAKLWTDKLETISGMNTSFAKQIGIDVLPKTLEELKALDDDTKKRLFANLGKSVSNIDAIMESYTLEEKDDAGNVISTTLGKNFLEDINYQEKLLREEQTLLFNSQLIEFLSDKNVKEEIIKRLSSAKYILPSVKQALTDFFTTTIEGNVYDLNGEPILDETTMEPELVSLKQSLVNEYLASFKDKPSSPVDVYLDNVVATLRSKGIQISPLVTNMEELVSKLAKARNLESFAYSDELERAIDLALQVIQLARVGLDSAATSINGDLSDAYGFNVSINEIRAKRGTDGKKLVTISADVAEGIKMDIGRYEQALKTFKTLLAYNSNLALKEHDKTFKTQNLNMYNKVKTFVGHLEAGDWKDVDKLKKAVEKSEFSELEDVEEINDEYKDKLTKARLELDTALYNFFAANSDIFNPKTKEDKEKSVTKISLLLKSLNFSFDYTKDTNTVLNSEEKSIPDKDLLWYFASMAAANPNSVLSKYSKVISSEYAPVIGQEEAIKVAVSFLCNPKIFLLFADAYNANIIEKANNDPEFKAKEAPSLLINAYRSIFVEGLPGSGKSTAVLKTITDIVHEIKPSALKKVIVVSNSKLNSERLAEGLKFSDLSEVQTFGIEEFKSKIMNDYKEFDINSDGSINVEPSDVKFDPEKRAYRYANFTLNADGLDGTFLIIDEATSLSLMDALMIDDFLEAKGIYGVYAGDFDLIGLTGKFDSGERTPSGDVLYNLITLDATNYISTHKLGQVIRGNNTYKSDNIINFKEYRYKFIESLLENGKVPPLSFSYYIDDTGVYGDVVAKYDKKTTPGGIVYDLDQGTKDIVDTMVKSLKEGEKINYIYDDLESEMYKYLKNNYLDKINLVSTKAAQSLEGLYYIVDIGIVDNLLRKTSGYMTATIQFKNLYTAMSRAKQATLIYDRGKNNENISKRLNSIRQNNLTHSIIGLESRRKYAESRIKSIEKATEKSEELKLNWDKESYTPPKKTLGGDSNKGDDEDDGTNEEETEDSKTDIRNTPKEVNIKNESNDLLHMMIHSFNTHEVGGIIDDKGQLELSDRHNERVDNAHGIIKALNSITDKDGNHPFEIKVTDGKLSKADTDKVLQILHGCRRAGLYEKTPQDVVANVRKAFKLDSSVPVEVNFIYRNTLENDTLTTRGAISKFFKGVKDTLLYLFNPNANRKLETPSTRTIDLEIFINGQQVDIPVGTLTSPITLMETKGFEKLHEIYVNSGEKLTDFELELKRIKAEQVRTGVDPKIPHLNSMLKLLEVYLWNYNHKTGNKNFAVRLDKNFVLNQGRITGVQTPPRERGHDYKDKDYWYVGLRLSLDEYRLKMPNRKISDIYENLGEDIKDKDGNVVLEHGVPFILVSDYYDKGLNDLSLYELYVKLVKNGEQPLITRVYVYLPTESIDYFLYNQQEALKRDEKKSASDVDNSIGNKLTSYRLLSFMLLNDSNFKRVFEDYINESKGVLSFNDELKERSLKRFERLQEIIKYINDYEQTLTPDYSKGSKSKQILSFLNKTPEEIKGDHPELYKKFWGNKSTGVQNIGDTNWTIRTILQYEFRKLLFTGEYYEDTNSSPSLSGQDYTIQKDGEGNYIYKDYLLDRIDALKKDADKNNWKGVMFHSSLEKESEMIASYGSESYKIARINAQGASFISSKPIELNGKLDSTATIIDTEPILDQILAGIVVDKAGTIVSSVNEKLSDDRRKQIWEENTGAYINGTPRGIDLTLLLFDKVLNLLDSESGRDKENTKLIKKYITENGTNLKEEDVLLNTFKGPSKFVIKEGSNKYKILTLPSNATALILDNNEVYYSAELEGIIRIYKGSNNLSIEDVNTLKLLLEINPSRKSLNPNALSIIEERIKKIITPEGEEKVTLQSVLDTIFGEGTMNSNEILSSMKGRQTLLEKFDAKLVSPEGKNEGLIVENYLLAYLTVYNNVNGRKALEKFQEIKGRNPKGYASEYLGWINEEYKTITEEQWKILIELLDKVLNTEQNESCIKTNFK